MKYMKVLLIAVITIITFGAAKAQDVVVKARVGGPVHRHYVHRPYYHRGHYHHPRGHWVWRHHRRYWRRY